MFIPEFKWVLITAKLVNYSMQLWPLQVYMLATLHHCAISHLRFPPFAEHLQIIQIIPSFLQSIMKSRLLFMLFGCGLGAGSHYAYRHYNPERNITQSASQIISSYIDSHEIQQGYLINVLKSVGFMLKGFYHYGMDTKMRGFNFNTTYLSKAEVNTENKDISKLYCIFNPTEYICGHPEIQHGGATATIIDQNMGYLAILHSKEMVVTAQLTVKYKKPIRQGNNYVLETHITKREGRKIWLHGIIKDLETGELKVESNALFITVHWDNPMSRILTKFFQAISPKDYAHMHSGETTVKGQAVVAIPGAHETQVYQQGVVSSGKAGHEKTHV